MHRIANDAEFSHLISSMSQDEKLNLLSFLLVSKSLFYEYIDEMLTKYKDT